MRATLCNERPLIDWHVATRRAEGQSVSGDLHVVQPFHDGMLVAVVDGVGHGDEAMSAARTAITVLEQHAEESVITLLRLCHEALRKTRGVVMTVASLHITDNMLTWTGVGNVEGRVLRADPARGQASENLLLRGGLVGYQLPALQASLLPIFPGDLLILASDGVHPGFDSVAIPGAEPRLVAEHILQHYGKRQDDALVLVARYIGTCAENVATNGSRALHQHQHRNRNPVKN